MDAATDSSDGPDRSHLGSTRQGVRTFGSEGLDGKALPIIDG
jgi:hypothetical protein